MAVGDLEPMDLGAEQMQLVTGGEQERSRGLVWVLSLVATQMVAFALVLAMDPGGFDACEAVPSRSVKAIQIFVAVASLAIPVGLWVTWLKRQYKILAVISLLLFVLFWTGLLAGGGTCEP
ncbi:MAG: hypothetical protein JWM47_1780 [Acidimicrobiales bacterium]|nr:hypothetical protein [Acidimicrobiales bacterium]